MKEISNQVEILIYYSNNHHLSPIVDLIHPGLIPIGKGMNTQKKSDIPNILWSLYHLLSLGFENITIITEIEDLGLSKIVGQLRHESKISVEHTSLASYLLKSATNEFLNVILLPGYLCTNANLFASFKIHNKMNYQSSLLTIRGHQHSVGLVELDEKDTSIIRTFKEKPYDRKFLTSSSILIANYSILDDFIDSLDIESFSSYSADELIHDFQDYCKHQSQLYSIELNEFDQDVCCNDLSSIENWIKLDHEDFMNRFKHIWKDIENY